MFREGLDRFFPSFGREGPLLRVGILSESEGVEVARRPVKETPRAFAGVFVAGALATMRSDLREGAPGMIQGAHLRLASEQLAAPAGSTLRLDRLRGSHLRVLRTESTASSKSARTTSSLTASPGGTGPRSGP